MAAHGPRDGQGPCVLSRSELRTSDLEAAVDAILARTGDKVMCATPLGLGKPVPLLNALYARIKA